MNLRIDRWRNPTREPRPPAAEPTTPPDIQTDDALVAYLRAQAPGLPSVGFDARAVTSHARGVRRRQRRRRLRNSAVAVAVAATAATYLALAGPVPVPGSHDLRALIGDIIPGQPPGPDQWPGDVDRLELEGRTTALAAERRTADQLAELDGILARQAAAEDPIALARINAEFHIAVAACSQNELMAGFVRSLSIRARSYFSTVAPDRREESLRDHRAIIEALRRRDGAEAERIGRAHVANTRVDVLRTLPGHG